MRKLITQLDSPSGPRRSTRRGRVKQERRHQCGFRSESVTWLMALASARPGRATEQRENVSLFEQTTEVVVESTVVSMRSPSTASDTPATRASRTSARAVFTGSLPGLCLLRELPNRHAPPIHGASDRQSRATESILEQREHDLVVVLAVKARSMCTNHHVGALLDRPRSRPSSKGRWLRPITAAPVHLRDHDDRAIERDRQGLEPPCDRGGHGVEVSPLGAHESRGSRQDQTHAATKVRFDKPAVLSHVLERDPGRVRPSQRQEAARRPERSSGALPHRSRLGPFAQSRRGRGRERTVRLVPRRARRASRGRKRQTPPRASELLRDGAEMLTEERLPHARLGEHNRHVPGMSPRIAASSVGMPVRTRRDSTCCISSNRWPAASALKTCSRVASRSPLSTPRSRASSRARAHAENAKEIRPADYFVPGAYSIEGLRSRAKPVGTLLIARG